MKKVIQSKFRVVPTDPTLKREGQLQRFLLKLKKKDIFTKEEYKKIYPTGSIAARIYGLPKIHKLKTANDKLKLRPIVSAIGSYNYHLADYLSKKLAPYISHKYTTKDTFSFVNELSEMKSKDKFLISYDVTSLFTNIPLDETIEIAVNVILENEPDIKIDKNELKKLFIFATSESHFVFKGKVYDQIDGVTMGSCLGPVLANLFMGHHEESWIEDCNCEKPTFYKRFMDDIFCVFNNQNEANEFFRYLNERHPNIKFTDEKENLNKLPFLDVQIEKLENGNFQTSVYRKPTFTDLLTNFRSFVPFSYKLAFIKTLIHRTFCICSSWTVFDQNILDLEGILKRNSFPPNVISKELSKYLNNKLSGNKKPEKESNSNYYKLPYIGEFSKKSKEKISELCQKYCKTLKIRISFSLFKTGSLFSVKDKICPDQRSFVVYLFRCPGCTASYIGETTRSLKVRIEEHLKEGKGSVIFNHLAKNPKCREMCNDSCFQVIDNATSEWQLKIKEAIHITWNKPTLNKQIKHIGLNISI